MKTYPMFSVWIAKEPISMLSPETKRTLRKLGKAQWEVVLWLNRETLPEAIARGLLPSAQPATVPEPIPAGECPF